MNTRVQVEHCVTEEVSGIDIVREQILIAAGETLSIAQDDVDAARPRDRVPHQRRGRRQELRPRARARSRTTASPAGPACASTPACCTGSEITPLYDPMVAKLIVWDVDREGATARMLRALDEFEIEGVTTLIPFHKAIMASEQWAKGETCRDLIEDRKWLKELAQPKPEKPRRRTSRSRSSAPTPSRCPASASTSPSTASRCSPRPTAPRPRRRASRRAASAPRAAAAAAPTSSPRRSRATCGRCWWRRAPTVEEGQLICIIEAMKMENEITAHKAGTIEDLPITEGAAVKSGDLLAVIK